MDIEIFYRPSYSLGVIKLDGGEKVRVEAASMVSMSSGVSLKTGTGDGLFSALGRSLLGGESFFQNSFEAPPGGGEVAVAPALPGDMLVVDMQDERLMVQSGSYVASAEGVDLDTRWSGAQTFFASEGLVMLRAEGSGKLLLSSYGAIHETNLGAGEGYPIRYWRVQVTFLKRYTPTEETGDWPPGTWPNNPPADLVPPSLSLHAAYY